MSNTGRNEGGNKERSSTTAEPVPNAEASASFEEGRGRGSISRGQDTNHPVSQSSTSDEAAEETLDERFRRLDFSVHVSRRYHARRRAWFDMCHRGAMTFAAVGGSAAFGFIFAGESMLAKGSTAIIALFSSLDIFFAPSEKARLHDTLYRRFSTLAAQMASTKEVTSKVVSKWERKRLELEVDEPTGIDALSVICHNIEAEARGYSGSELRRVRWYQRLFCQLITMPPNNFPPSVVSIPAQQKNTP